MRRDRILLAHGGGGSLTRELIEKLFLPSLENPLLKTLDDSAVLVMGGKRHAFTTDSYVVKPLIFPGGDIGKLAVCGTVNDLAVMGARPLWLSLSFILEEGLLLADLQEIVESIGATAREARVQIVTGDTKVVEHGKCEGLYINTAGLGDVVAPNWLGSANVKPGDVVVINGPIGEHGVAVMSQREGIAFQTNVVSDCAPLWTRGPKFTPCATQRGAEWPPPCVTSRGPRTSEFVYAKMRCRSAAKCAARAICWGLIR